VLSLNALRMLVAAVPALLLPFFIGPIGAHGQETSWGVLCVIVGGIFSMGIGDGVYFKSQELLGVSRAQPISSIAPIFTAILASAFLGEQPTWALVGAFPLVMAGVSLLAMTRHLPDSTLESAGARNVQLGITLAISAAMCWAISNVLFRQALLEMDVIRANQLRIPAVALCLLVAMWVAHRPMDFRTYGWRTMTSIAVVGVTNIAFGSLFYLYSVQTAGATRAALILSLTPLFAAPLALVFLGEKLTWKTLLGMLSCIGAVWLVLISAEAA
jgi:drug/metabolite transporter (DMT)-like permease